MIKRLYDNLPHYIIRLKFLYTSTTLLFQKLKYNELIFVPLKL